MYAAYDLSGVKSSEERQAVSVASGGSGFLGVTKAFKAPSSRRSKYLTVDDITAVLATISYAAYHTLFRFSEGDAALDGVGIGMGAYHSELGDGHDCRSSRSYSSNAGPIDDEAEGETPVSGNGACGIGGNRACSGSEGERAGGVGGNEEANARQRSVLVEQALEELARRNAAEYAARVVEEFGQVHDDVLTQKEFETWALTGPVLRCRINEFSLDVNVMPFQGIQLA